MKRRDFLRFGLGLGTSSMLGGISQLAVAANDLEKSQAKQSGPFIVVFLRGGADGLAILSPLDDVNFQAARPPEMRFTPDKAGGVALNIPAAIVPKFTPGSKFKAAVNPRFAVSKAASYGHLGLSV